VKLSPRQEQVAALVVRGYSNKAIGKELGLAENSVVQYLDRISKRIPGEGKPRIKVFRWWYEIRNVTS
jgi:DNA-binding CsgD family transcriptional regulator